MKETVPFEYNGYHFKPYLTLRGKDALHDEIATRLSSDLELAMGTSWSFDDFFKKSSVTYCDLFMCLENGNLYIPGKNGLFKYEGTPQDLKTIYYNNPCFAKKPRDYER